MQSELDADYPYLAVDLLGVNGAGHESGNKAFCNGRDIPWLQDVDANGDGGSDTWQAWQVTFRDVVILDRNNIQIGKLNLTTHSLSLPQNYQLLLEMLIDAATIRGDLNRDGVVSLLDIHRFVELFTSGQYQREGDFNQDDIIDINDVGPFIVALRGF
jgi:hypothetical protein